MVARPGFERLVAWLCTGEIGAVLCFDASRLARNGRDWHHLLELCGLVEARVIDLDGVYDPCRPNDRLLLGMKGSISEFELGVLRARMLDAARAKARRGELRVSVPVTRLAKWKTTGQLVAIGFLLAGEAGDRVLPVVSWKCRVSWVILPPAARISACRMISERIARSTLRRLLTP